MMAQTGFLLPSQGIGPFVRNCNQTFIAQLQKRSNLYFNVATANAREPPRLVYSCGRAPKGKESILNYTRGLLHLFLLVSPWFDL